ncbi:MAG: tripartite tricarboxylate transporter substrate binding protein [Lachnospiraceae bacterium]|nr:tripartite tricarboxylate transporter substrate binding protein [Lachnospiraceae bacterium]
MKKFAATLLALIMVLSLSACGSKADYPGKQITLICPLAAGGGSDTISRLFAAALEKELGVSVITENKPGAGAGIGLEAIAAADKDGYTIGYIPAEVTTVEAMGNATVTPENFEFICTAMKISALICVPADSEWNTLEDLIAAAKADPGAVTIGTAGVGNAYELGLRAMLKSAGIEMNIVNFSGGTAEAITAMMGGNVQCCTAGTAEALSYVNSGEFRLLCNLSAERSALFPDTPTATELGYACDGGSWGAFAAPAGTPAEVMEILRKAGETILNSEDFKATLAERGFDEYHVEAVQFKTDAQEMYGTNSAIIEEFNLSAN